MEERVEVQLVVPERALAAVESEVAGAEGQVTVGPTSYTVPASQLDLFGDQQFDPLTVLTVAVSLAFVADRVSRIVRRHTGGPGLVIDATKGVPQLIETFALDHGEVLVIREDGTESFREEGLERAMASVSSIFAGR